MNTFNWNVYNNSFTDVNYLRSHSVTKKTLSNVDKSPYSSAFNLSNKKGNDEKEKSEKKMVKGLKKSL